MTGSRQRPVGDFRTARAAELAREIGAEFSEWLGDTVYAFQVAPTQEFIYISPSVMQLSGYTDEEHYQDPSIAIESTDPRDRPLLQAAFAAPVDEVTDVVVRWIRRDGEVIWTRHRCRKREHDDGVVVVYASVRDVTAQAAAEAAREASDSRYRLLAENASDVVWQADNDGVLVWVSPSVENVMGWKPSEMVGRRIADLTHPDDVERVTSAGGDVTEGDRVFFEARYATKNGSYRWLEITARPVTNDDGQVTGRVGSCRDVNSEIEAWQAMERSESRFRMAMESAPTGMALMDLERRFVEVNPALCHMLAIPADKLVGRRMLDVLNATDDEIDLRMRDELLSGGATSTMHEIRLVRSDGNHVWVQHAMGLLRDDDGLALTYVSQFVNVTEAREARDALHFMATHDPLTHLINRRELMARMGKVLAHAPRSRMRLAVLFADLDGLKNINDTFGHGAGDDVIVQVAKRLDALVRGDDIASRIGGDEFVVVLPAISGVDDALAVANKIRAAVAEPITIDGYPVAVSVSIGVALARHGEDAEGVIRHADAALYDAKRAGRNQVIVFEDQVTT